MNPNEELIHKFYRSFQSKDYQGMQGCYADTATFSDAVFTNLNASEVKAMWEMLCLNGKDLEIEFTGVTANDKTGKATWVARYTFSKTGKKVVNRIQANFEFKDGLISQHRDSFSFHNWASQALGISGFLFGWMPFFKEKVRRMAKGNLEKFIAKKLAN